MIPKKIHYCWFGDKPLPPDAVKCINSWKKNMPNFEIIEWNEINFDVHSNKYMEQAYKSKKFAFVSDYARLKILYEEGGVYFDVDVELIKPLSTDMMENGFLAMEDRNHINTGLGFACRRHDIFIKKMLDEYDDINFFINDNEMDLTPCTIRNTNTIKQFIENKDNKLYIGKLKIYPHEYFNPLNNKTGLLNITINTYSIHYGAASWLDDIDKKLLDSRHKLIKKYGKICGIIMYIIKKFFVYLVHKPRELKKLILKKH